MRNDNSNKTITIYAEYFRQLVKPGSSKQPMKWQRENLSSAK